MVVPPSPESPAIRFHRTRNNLTSSTPRVGMFVSHEDDDDVSVLTFHTLGTKDTLTSSPLDGHRHGSIHNESKHPIGGGKNGNNDRSMNGDDARSNMVYNRQSSEDDEAEDQHIKKSLSHISEESRNSSSSSHGMYKSPKNKQVITEYDHAADDDESLSLAESVLDSANKILSSIGSSSYYSGLSTKLKSDEVQENFYSSPQKLPPSPMNLRGANGFRVGKPPSENVPRREDDSPRTTRYDHGNLRCTTPLHHEQSCYNDAQNENSNQSNLHARHNPLDSYTNAAGGTGKGDKLRKIQEETRRLQQLLREQQHETKLARSELDASIRKASELLLN